MRLLRLPGCIALAFALVAAGVACGDESAAVDVVSPVRGMIVEVVAAQDGGVESITLRDDAGQTVEFEVQLAEDAFVSAQHLQEHIDGSLPVLVAFTGTGDGRVAHRIDDAP